MAWFKQRLQRLEERWHHQHARARAPYPCGARALGYRPEHLSLPVSRVRVAPSRAHSGPWAWWCLPGAPRRIGSAAPTPIRPPSGINMRDTRRRLETLEVAATRRLIARHVTPGDDR